MTGSAPSAAAEMVQRLRGEPDEHMAVERQLLSARLAHAERLGDMGWAEWNLQTGEATWSEQMHLIFGRDPGEGAVPLRDLPGHAEAADRPGLDRLLWAVVHRSVSGEVEFRIRRRGEVRHLRAVLDSVTAGGRAAVHAVVQDITDRRRAERIMSESRDRLLQIRERAAQERHMSVALRDAIMPGLGEPIELPHARVAVRYVAAGVRAGLGGDWYDALPLPDGRALLAIGDVSGHGMPAISQMAQLRHALIGLAMTGHAPDRLLAWLNDLVLHRMPESTATAVVGHLDPVSGTFTWGQAGHPAPILVRDGRAVQLDPPVGVLLGATCDEPYALKAVGVRRGDLLLLFTDGLVERRTRDIDEGFSLALEAAALLRDDLDDGLDRLIRTLGGPNPEDDTCVLAIDVLG
ncbi:serine phosphatase RsbU (regulator of sigma subunit) [Streptosporangium becharense]|uniref:Serine phosphatase RsbU (Regulator of sigma subunit) n=1 Tax=Streptosporangium becharense TaxID=1816182 RepID=A0A7W9IBS1_9ACTN|nr:SpoIIE family protein phosphatase [Streptosporangium becharense]MBB2913722.1 serine phosphatase RsbU (regulator of sigma subunit) [Streptosporangium becharense]MBB5817803.1 serine phosphatase RsbU (regulator of sigma subunit) [Streptosporangium becharense]